VDVDVPPPKSPPLVDPKAELEVLAVDPKGVEDPKPPPPERMTIYLRII
jgi:hypothetical protein